MELNHSKFESELSRIISEYGLEIDSVELVEVENLSEYHYNIIIPSYWTEEFTEGVFKICNSHMFHYCNEHNLWDCLIDTSIIFK